jgi:hypothetical protein
VMLAGSRRALAAAVRAPAAATPPWPTACIQTLSPSPEPA